MNTSLLYNVFRGQGGGKYNILRKKNPDYMKLFKKHGLGQVRISDNDILEIFPDAAIYYKISIIPTYGIPKKTYRKMRHRIDGPSYIPKFIDWSNKGINLNYLLLLNGQTLI